MWHFTLIGSSNSNLYDSKEATYYSMSVTFDYTFLFLKSDIELGNLKISNIFKIEDIVFIFESLEFTIFGAL